MSTHRFIGSSNKELIDYLKKNGKLTSSRVEKAMLAVDRGNFVPFQNEHRKYVDSPVRIGYGATISAPQIHACALELLKDHLRPGETVLDVGSGSGYITACMAQMVGKKGQVVGIEHIPELLKDSIENLVKGNSDLLESERIILKVGDGRFGCPEFAPYNAIHVGAASPELPEKLIEQLKPGGRLIIPIGEANGEQYLEQIDKLRDGSIKREKMLGVIFVPLTDKAEQWRF